VKTACCILAFLSLAVGIPRGLAASLNDRVGSFVRAPRFEGASWGVKVVAVKSGAILAGHRTSSRMNPASNAKLFTGALVLDRFGPEHRFVTRFYSHVKADEGGVLKGDLIVQGGGDFSMAARFHGGDYKAAVGRLVTAVKAAGIRKIEGEVLADDTLYTRSGPGLGWDWDDLPYYYGAPASALMLEDNTVDLKILPGKEIGQPCVVEPLPGWGMLHPVNRIVTGAKGEKGRIEISRGLGQSLVEMEGMLGLAGSGTTEAVSVPDGSVHFLKLFEAALAKAGISFKRGPVVPRLARRVEMSRGLKLLAEVEGAPIRETLPVMMQRSNNLYAQMMFLNVGAFSELPREGGDSTEDLSKAELEAFLKRAGIQAGSVYLHEGSGLSRGDLLSADSVCDLLLHMTAHPQAKPFRESLPVAGRSGTLEGRFKGTFAEGNLRAKTGTLRFVHALSGYATRANGDEVVFSILLNHHRVPSSEARGEIDALVRMILE